MRSSRPLVNKSFIAKGKADNKKTKMSSVGGCYIALSTKDLTLQNRTNKNCCLTLYVKDTRGVACGVFSLPPLKHFLV